MIHVCGILNGIRREGGAARNERAVAEILAQWQRRPGVTVEIVTGDSGYTALSPAYPRLVFRTPKTAKAKPLGRFDIVVASSLSFPDVLPALWLKMTFRARRVAVYVPRLLPAQSALLLRPAMEVADFFWVDDGAVADTLVARGVPVTKIQNISIPYQQVEAEAVPEAPARFDAISIGPRSLKKSTDLLLKTWLIVQNQLLDVRLILSGYDEAGFDTQARVQHAGITSSVTFLDGMSDGQIITLLKSTRLFIMPVREEPDSRMMLEALACGTPCASFDVPSFREAFPHGRLIAKEQTPEALAEKIVAFLENPSLQQQLREDIRTQFQPRRWDNIADILWSHAFRT